ncbi:MAG TPA: sugar ABC transporter ATP-binding protein, partial [Acidothermaceae bacterium]|nr:sugar ABC transporter ATP-binding protein [Acidothermaceae bacterium]
VGENGAGKSTLLKIMAGVYSADAGSLVLEGETLTGLTPRDAQRHGIYLVPQEPRLMPDLSVAENLYLGALPRGAFSFNVDWRAMTASTDGLLASVGLDLDSRMLAGRLSLAQQQLLECARALAHGCRVIFFDEPTSPLTAQDADRLFALIRDLRDRGLTLGFISHRFDEVEAISDRITVLRDGHVVAQETRQTATRQGLVAAMVGRTLTISRRAHRPPNTGRVVLEVTDVRSPPQVNGISLHVREGELVGLAGLVGSGRTELAESIFGLRTIASGVVRVDERDLVGASPRSCIDAGLIYLAEDRGRNGVFAEVDLSRNVTSATIGTLPRLARVLLRRSAEERRARAAVEQVHVRASSMGAAMKTLSGGNQQRALFARWMMARPRVAIFDEPTRGVDIGAKEGIYEIIEGLAAGGLAGLVISSELEELVRLCDRVYAIYEGRVVGALSGDEITVAALGELAVGAP